MACDYVRDYEFAALFDADFQRCAPDLIKLLMKTDLPKHPPRWNGIDPWLGKQLMPTSILPLIEPFIVRNLPLGHCRNDKWVVLWDCQRLCLELLVGRKTCDFVAEPICLTAWCLLAWAMLSSIWACCLILFAFANSSSAFSTCLLACRLAPSALALPINARPYCSFAPLSGDNAGLSVHMLPALLGPIESCSFFTSDSSD